MLITNDFTLLNKKYPVFCGKDELGDDDLKNHKFNKKANINNDINLNSYKNVMNFINDKFERSNKTKENLKNTDKTSEKKHVKKNKDKDNNKKEHPKSNPDVSEKVIISAGTPPQKDTKKIRMNVLSKRIDQYEKSIIIINNEIKDLDSQLLKSQNDTQRKLIQQKIAKLKNEEKKYMDLVEHCKEEITTIIDSFSENNDDDDGLCPV